jgi:hypothetical protein
MTILNILFFIVASVLLLLCLLLVLQSGILRLESRMGRARDGFPPGTELPHWSLPDLTGQIHRTPSKKHCQLLIFTTHALGAFPRLVELIEHLNVTEKKLEIIILSSAPKDICEAMGRGLDLHVPVVRVDMSFYRRFRVRVMPFAFIVDSSGIIHWVGIASARAVEHAWQLLQRTQAIACVEVLR